LKCFHEVAGNAAQYFNPYDPEEIAFCIENTISDNKLLNDMRNKGKLQLEKFTWEKSAENTKKVYENLL
jgi:glycosyltransferase involved in cell wall biosynthesis